MRIVLIGNYAPDRQESMLRYGEMMLRGLAGAVPEVTLVAPRSVLNWRRRGQAGIWKWIGYADKYCVGRGEIARAVATADVVHVCDHSNAVYIPRRPRVPHVVTCHDLLAVRGALGEDTDCPASPTGRWLQRSILHGLRRAQVVACVSRATLGDAKRLLGSDFAGRIVLTPNALNYPYSRLGAEETAGRLAAVRGLAPRAPYVLHVGDNHRRKNRAAVLHAVAKASGSWPGRLVLAGLPMDRPMHSLAASLGILDRIVEVVKPSNELLEALYNGADALVFPSRFEGFGWPIIEAQACGCPVICSDRPPLPEVAGHGAIVCSADDADGIARAILDVVANTARREELRRLGAENAERYRLDGMVQQFLEIYAGVTGHR